jgi:hypothetical protein
MRAAVRSKRVRVTIAAIIIVVVLLAGAAALVITFDPALFYPPASSITDLHATRPAYARNRIPALDAHASNPGAAQRAYQAMLDLPRSPSGTYACGAELVGTAITLTFLQGQQTALTALVRPGGCGTVQISDRDVRALDSGFVQVLAVSLGITVNDINSPGTGVSSGAALAP